MERRQTVRLKVQFRSAFSAPLMVAGEGTVLDLSPTGCRIATQVHMSQGTTLEVRLALPDNLPPLAVESCVVRWARNHEFGVQFLSFNQETDRARLARFVETVPSDSPE
jgi:hypothetical protein